MKSLKLKRSMVAGAVLGLMALAGMNGAAMATPTLTIVDANNNAVSNQAHKEVTGDPGGTNYTVGNGTKNGPGIPSAGAGWPGGPGFGPDPTFPPALGGAMGTTGWHASFLYLDKAADVTFQYMGSGDAGLQPRTTFGIDFNNNGTFDASEILFTAGTTDSCAMFGGTTPLCNNKNVAGGNEFTYALSAGRIKFFYGGAIDSNGDTVVLDNTGMNDGNPDTAPGNMPGYFLGVDPYQAAGQYQTSGTAVYAGLTDMASGGDHDFQDLGVRISVVPEPSGIALAFAGLAGLAYSRSLGSKRKA